MTRIVTMVEGIPTDSQIEEMLDAMGIPPDDDSEIVQEHVGPPGHDHPVGGIPVEPLPDEGDEETADDGEPDEGEPTEDDTEDDASEEPDEVDVIPAMSRALANTFAMYLRAHVFHWNVVGPNFVQYHQYLDSLNGELFAAVDPLAEHLRAVGGLAPSGMTEFCSLSTVADPGDPQPEPEAMWTELLAANDEVMESLSAAFDAAGDDQGLLNFLGERLDVHAKHAWFLRSLAGHTP
jgi:starvation-inducible DNA-binding protein